jgi:hypothetical protein
LIYKENPMPSSKNIYQLKVTLDDSKPPIWRRILVPDDITLFDLHEILQRVMGWKNYHLHQFILAGQYYGDPEDDEMGNLGTVNEKRYHLNQLGLREKAKFSYEYDFGDSWAHTLLVEKILSAEVGVRYPVCVAGKRACPPEDCGGIWGYADFLETITDPNHEDHDQMLEWAGGDFDPEEFNLDAVNATLEAYKPARGRRKVHAGAKLEGKADNFMSSADDQKKMEALAKWVQNLSQAQVAAIETLPLRRDLLTFLDYLSKNRTVGTQSTGNLPLKAVHEICANYVKPPVLEEFIGTYIRKVRSEDEVWPLLFVHHLAFHSRLVTGGQARIWKVTAEGQQFPQLPPPVQIFFLLAHWWVQIDWTIAFPVSGLANGLPVDFKPASLACLRELPVGENRLYKPFADHLITKSGLEWRIADQTSAQSIIRSVVERLVIYPMVKFGILECEYGPENIAGMDFQKLANVRLTPTGKGLLGLLG